MSAAYASRAASPPPMQGSLRAGGLRLCREGVEPSGSQRKVSGYIHPPFQDFPDASWAHARRNFFEVHAATQSPLALEALQRIAALYAIEATIRGQPPDARLAARIAQSAPLFTALRQWLEKTQARIPGKSELAKAIRYTLSRWQALTLVLRDGRACIDNNAAERSDAADGVGTEELVVRRF